MMQRDLPSLLRYEAKHNTDLARLIAEIGTVNVEQIKRFKVKLPWIRRALLQLKAKHDYDQLASRSSEWAIHGTTPDPYGEMRCWVGQDRFVKLAHGQELEMHHGQLIWLNAGVWIDSIFVSMVDPLLLQCTESCGMTTRSGYLAAVRDRVNKLHVTVDQPRHAIYIYRPQR